MPNIIFSASPQLNTRGWFCWRINIKWRNFWKGKSVISGALKMERSWSGLKSTTNYRMTRKRWFSMNYWINWMFLSSRFLLFPFFKFCQILLFFLPFLYKTHFQKQKNINWACFIQEIPISSYSRFIDYSSKTDCFSVCNRAAQFRKKCFSFDSFSSFKRFTAHNFLNSRISSSPSSL